VIVFGWIFVAAATAHFVLGVVLRLRPLGGFWANTDVPVSRIGDAAWSACILSWGLAVVIPPSDLVAGSVIAACLASTAVLALAGRYDLRAHRRRTHAEPIAAPDRGRQAGPARHEGLSSGPGR
jgi:hypothetical protein